ncbi:MAG: 6-phosphofructokinase [Firmicutes bacterium]|nr:6-phosphofructokinase [Bacillota bacterium]
MKICVLASGGDAPGMNACVESLFIHANARGWDVWGATHGYNGLVDDNVVKLGRDNATFISHVTGCFLKSGRSEAFGVQAGFNKAVSTVKKHGFNCVVVLGGNGSLRGAADLQKAGVNIIGVCATIDNDVKYTRESLGFSSAVEESVRLIDNLNGTMRTNDRDHVVQVMGWHCDELANMIGMASFADIIDKEGSRLTPQQIASIFENNRKQGKTSNLVIRQEKRGKGIDVIGEAVESVNYLGELSQAVGGNRVRMMTLGHLQRGAVPSARDRWLGHNYGRLAVESIAGGKFGVVAILINGEFKIVAL